jgi:hypothetical protein
MSIEHNTSGMVAVLLSLDFKFVNDLKNNENARIVTVPFMM